MKAIDKQKHVRHILMDQQGSALEKYKAMTTGDVGMLRFFFYEVVTWLLGARSGALGILLRKKMYKSLFRSCGRNIIIGRNCIFRHPSKISFGDNVVIDDNCVIDARGCSKDGIIIANDVIINRNSAIQSKGGDISIGEGVSLGSDSHLVSWGGISIGARTAIAGGCYISTGTYRLTDFLTPISERQPYTAGPVTIGENVWIATRATILDGVEIGNNAVVAAGAVVNSNMDAKVVAHGNPAKVVFQG